MRRPRLLELTLLPTLLLAACATMPNGPSISVMPAKGKTLAEFQQDDALCRQFAHSQVSRLTPNDAAASSAAKSAVVGTALGAAAGAAFDGGEGAAIGAGAGLLGGSAVGAGMAGASAGEVQYRYDNAYSQCMVTQGNEVPRENHRVAAGPPPPPADYYAYEAPPPPYYPCYNCPPPPAYYPPPPPPYYGYWY